MKVPSPVVPKIVNPNDETQLHPDSKLGQRLGATLEGNQAGAKSIILPDPEAEEPGAITEKNMSRAAASAGEAKK